MEPDTAPILYRSTLHRFACYVTQVRSELLHGIILQWIVRLCYNCCNSQESDSVAFIFCRARPST